MNHTSLLWKIMSMCINNYIHTSICIQNIENIELENHIFDKF